jgi:hypothetical protein
MLQASNYPKRSKSLIGWRVLAFGFAGALLFLSGCSTPQPKATWWNPGTWFSGRAGDRVDAHREDVREHQTDLLLKQDNLVRLAQEEARLTGFALEAAPASPPVDLARGFSDSTILTLSEASGATDELRIQELKQLISGLLSENEEIRTDAEKLLAGKDREISASIEEKEDAQLALDQAKAELAESVGLLEVAFDRENALANKYRNIRFLFILLIVLFVVIIAAQVYFRFVGMGALRGIIGSVERFKGDPGMDDLLTDISRSMNNSQKKLIRAERARSIRKGP